MSGSHQHVPMEHWEAVYGMNHPYPAPSQIPWKTKAREFVHAGLVTAAGASSRMGSPKALLRLPDGTPLAQHQSEVLKRGGCSPVMIILGSEAECIALELTTCDTVINAQWRAGRLTSVQSGLQALDRFDGCFIMPVDAVGIKPETLRAVREVAETGEHDVLRPTHGGKPGHLVWISRTIAEHVMAIQVDGDTPLNEILAPHTKTVPVDDPAIVRNINTPEDWEKVRTAISNSL